MLTITLPLLLCAFVAGVVPVVAVDSDFKLELLTNSYAKCLDGSAAGFYHHVSPTSRSWLIHFEGGGWCPDADQCAARAASSLGSSKSWPPSKMDDFDGGSHGLFSTDASVNPDFHDWNMVRVQYCDGLFYAGDRVEPYLHNGKNLYFRGRHIVEDTFWTLLHKFNMSTADQIIITGCSAGGIAVYLHLDWIREQLPSSIRVVGAADSGFFLDIPNYKGEYIWGPIYNASFYLHNATFVDSDCLDTIPRGSQYKCASVAHSAKFVSTPIFVMNSLADSYQLQNTLMLDCFKNGQLQHCSDAETKAISNFRVEMINEVKAQVLNKQQNGAYLPSCLTHCGACTDNFWDKTSVESVHLRSAFSSWYFNNSRSPHVLIDHLWPSNACLF